jgi:hypothetical protein
MLYTCAWRGWHLRLEGVEEETGKRGWPDGREGGGEGTDGRCGGERTDGREGRGPNLHVSATSVCGSGVRALRAAWWVGAHVAG